ncbi:DUF6207 family protein [Streptomyces sp. NBC_00057]|uniref:DUF6207 family protein n=1 Tax=Streptomyces sp. NBC_00057 TaxID=2975634 RepID=UPI0038689B97
MRIDEQHITEPGLVVLDVTAADENTIRAVMDSLQRWWATSGIYSGVAGSRRGGGEGAGVRGHPTPCHHGVDAAGRCRTGHDRRGGYARSQRIVPLSPSAQARCPARATPRPTPPHSLGEPPLRWAVSGRPVRGSVRGAGPGRRRRSRTRARRAGAGAGCSPRLRW